MHARFARVGRRWAIGVAVLAMSSPVAIAVAPAAAHAAPGGVLKPVAGRSGGMDCNGDSPLYPAIRKGMACTDVRGFYNLHNANNWDGRFWDNGTYIGHDEPDMTFLSARAGSGDAVTWNETLPADPAALPTVATPGSDVTHYFELTIAPWFSMALCDGLSYPQLPCTPQSDKNAPACLGLHCASNAYPGAGSAFLEMQFYPPGDAPFFDSVSCDNTHWCASLHINELECTFGYVICNTNCEETTNFAFVQRNGVPTGPPSPQLSDAATSTPNAETLLMNPGDHLAVRIFDAPASGGGKALEVAINDLTTHQSGFMQASAANGFAQTNMVNCDGHTFNFQPEYATARAANVVPWAALQTNISTEFEIGHFEACTSVANQVSTGGGGSADPIFNTCTGPYESASDSGTPEAGDAPCFTNGDTHGTLNSPPNEVAGCLDSFFQNGDLDFDGSGYWPDWPKGNAAGTFPSTFRQSPPTSGGHPYPLYFFQSDVALSESGCVAGNTHCTIPPKGPGHFYPYWSLKTTASSVCTIEFGNVSAGVNDFGKDGQYGHDRSSTLGFDEFEGPVLTNHCA